MTCAERELTLVQGDLFSPVVTIDGADAGTIARVFFSSGALGVTKELFPSGGKWQLRISSEETGHFPLGRAEYDITVAFSDGNRYTARYGGMLTVLEKKNGVRLDEE